MIFKVGICDDNPNYLKILNEEFKNFKVQNVDICLEMFEDSCLLLEKISDYDLLILDIQMPNLTGLDIKEKIEKFNIPIIFFTNYDKYMKFSFGKNVYGFVNKDDLWELKYITKKVIIEKFSYRFIMLGDKKMEINQILYLKADTVYTEIYTISFQVIVRKTLKEFLVELDSFLFFRVHRSYAVNMKHVKTINKYVITLSNNKNIPISRSRYNSFINNYINYLNRNVGI